MKIRGQSKLCTGQQRKFDPVLEAARRKAYRGNRNVSTGSVTVLAAGTDIAAIALQKTQMAWAGAGEVRLGICSSPTSASFPDGKVHPRPFRE